MTKYHFQKTYVFSPRCLSRVTTQSWCPGTDRPTDRETERPITPPRLVLLAMMQPRHNLFCCPCQGEREGSYRGERGGMHKTPLMRRSFPVSEGGTVVKRETGKTQPRFERLSPEKNPPGSVRESARVRSSLLLPLRVYIHSPDQIKKEDPSPLSCG